MTRWFVFMVLVLALAAGCSSGPEPRETQLRPLDYQGFLLQVQPILLQSCSNPSCHANSERPLSLFAPLGWRADPELTFRLEPLSKEELWHNYSVSCALASEGENPADTLFLRKPLAQHARTYHGGGAVFDGTADARWRVLKAWVALGWSP
jgi:hypothetical protein